MSKPNYRQIAESFANKNGFEKVKPWGEKGIWKGFHVFVAYKFTFKGYIGKPIFVLVDDNGSVRFVTSEETDDIIYSCL